MPEAAKITAYTDGACSGNPGPGGWGVLLRCDGREKALSGGERLTTNNRMELTAAVEAFRALTRPSTVEMHTDSQYLRLGITEWIRKWKANGWRTATRQPVKNEDLWRQLEEAMKPHAVTWRWVRGHAGEPGNERADELARAGMAPFLRAPARRRADIG